MNKPDYHVASFSGGKDSTAMVLHMLERGDHLDEVIFCDTTMEFPALLRHVLKVKQIVEAAGIKFTALRSEHDFEYYLTAHNVKRRKTNKLYGHLGYGWPDHLSRWCTRALKVQVINRYLRGLSEKYNPIQYIGIAIDETSRLERASNRCENMRHPLAEWGWSEADALNYCYSKGCDWEGLYNLFSRVSCWCCPLQGYDELRNLRRYFPELWARLNELDKRQSNKFAHGYSIADFDRRFVLEDKLIESGYSIKNRQFFTDLKRLLADEATVDEILGERTKKA